MTEKLFTGTLNKNQNTKKMAFSTAFTTKVAPQCRAFSMALKIEKIKAPLLCSPKGAGDTKDCYNIATA